MSDRYGVGYGKPKMADINKVSNLAGVLGESSFFLFKALGLTTDLINHEVEDWSSLESCT